MSIFADSHVLSRVRAGSCGLRPSAILPAQGYFPVSSCHSSLRPHSPKQARSPQRLPSAPLYINELCADESSGLFSALVGRRNCPRQRRAFQSSRPVDGLGVSSWMDHKSTKICYQFALIAPEGPVMVRTLRYAGSSLTDAQKETNLTNLVMG